MLVGDAIAGAAVQAGATTAFGVAGSGNFLLVNALRDARLEYRATCHEAGAVAMADGFARASGRVGVATTHQGPGFTNSLTALTEAARSRSPLVLFAAEVQPGANPTNQALEQAPLVESVGARALELADPSSAPGAVAEAFRLAATEQRPVVVLLAPELVGRPDAGGAVELPAPPAAVGAPPDDDEVQMLAAAVAKARRPLVVGGRGAASSDAGPALRELAENAGAILATTVPAKGLFTGDPFDAGFLGGLASDLTTELAGQTDLALVFGSSLSTWTTCGGRIPGPQVDVALIDTDPGALARHHDAWATICADAGATARALANALKDRDGIPTWRRPELAARLADYRPADQIPPPDSGLVDPRRLAAELDERLPENRIVALDSGHFLAFPTRYVRSPDGRSFLFGQGFQAVGLGLGLGIGAAVARPGRIVAAFLGDGGARMSLLEIETAARYSLPVAAVIFDDGGYGAEIHDFAPFGVPVDVARFPSRDWAAVGRALGAEGATVRCLDDLAALDQWLEQPDKPLVLDCKVDPEVDAVTVITEVGAAEWSMSPPLGT